MLSRILLVEDNPQDAELALKALGNNHLANEVLHVWDGAEALDYMRRSGEYAGRLEGNPAVVLLDLKMPKVDGLEVLRQLKADPLLKMVPVVVMTSSREDRDLSACYELGVNAYVVKPVEFQSFVEAVQQVGAFWAVLNELPPGCIPKRDASRG